MISTPNPVDQYSRLMVDLFDEREVIGVSTGFQAFFGASESGSKTVFSESSSLVEIDIIRGNEKTAALIQRGQLAGNSLNTKDVSDQKFSSFSRVYPLGEEESVITVDQINQRIAGEQAYAGLQRQDRLKTLSLNNHMEHVRRFVRMFEVLAAQSILTGKMDAILGTSNADFQYDFRRNTDNIFTVGTAWDQVGALPMVDIDTGCNVVRENGKVNPDMAIVGGGAMKALLDNDSFQKAADNRRFELIMIGKDTPVPAKYDRFVKAGFIARGLLRTAEGFELYLFTYVDGYTNSAGAFTKYMPSDKMVICSSGARADRYFGPNEIMPMNSQRLDIMANMFGIQNPETMSMPNIKGDGIVLPSMFSYDAYAHQSNKGIVTRTQTAPIFATTMTDGFVTLEGLTTP